MKMQFKDFRMNAFRLNRGAFQDDSLVQPGAGFKYYFSETLHYSGPYKKHKIGITFPSASLLIFLLALVWHTEGPLRPVYGQTNQLHNDAVRFVMSGDCVFDNDTGLIWTRNPHGKGLDRFDWYSATDYVKELNLCGYSDWRLPALYELKVLYKGRTGSPADFLNNRGFIGLKKSKYWTSTQVSDKPDSIVVVDFYGGVLWGAEKNYQAYILSVCERAGKDVMTGIQGVEPKAQTLADMIASERPVAEVIAAMKKEKDIVQALAIEIFWDRNKDKKISAPIFRGYGATGAFIKKQTLKAEPPVDRLLEVLRSREVKMKRLTNISIVATLYPIFIDRGEPDSEPLLIRALNEQGHLYMAEDFLNCGHRVLSDAADAWARKKGYKSFSLNSLPGSYYHRWGGD